jgi:hypothetical protein
MRLLPILFLAVCLGHAQRTDGSFERNLKVAGPVDLDLTTDAGGISVVPGPTGSVRIRGILRASGNWLNRGDVESRIRELESRPPIEQSGNTIRVAVHDRSLLKGISMRLEVETSPDSHLRARSDSGGVEVRGIKGPIDCRTDSGGIRASEIGGEIRAAADSGGIHIRRANGPAYAQGDSGGIDALEIAGGVNASVDSGGVRISQTVAAPIKARTDSGGIDITLAGTGGYDVRASAGSGRVTATVVTVSGTISRHRLNGKVRGGGPLVDAGAGSGNIVIR